MPRAPLPIQISLKNVFRKIFICFFLYWRFYPHRSSDLMTPVHGIFLKCFMVKTYFHIKTGCIVNNLKIYPDKAVYHMGCLPTCFPPALWEFLLKCSLKVPFLVHTYLLRSCYSFLYRF